MTTDYEYAIYMKDVPNYGKVKVLFGLREKEYNHDENGIFVIDVREVKTRIQYRSLKIMLERDKYI